MENQKPKKDEHLDVDEALYVILSYKTILKTLLNSTGELEDLVKSNAASFKNRHQCMEKLQMNEDQLQKEFTMLSTKHQELISEKEAAQKEWKKFSGEEDLSGLSSEEAEKLLATLTDAQQKVSVAKAYHVFEQQHHGRCCDESDSDEESDEVEAVPCITNAVPEKSKLELCLDFFVDTMKNLDLSNLKLCLANAVIAWSETNQNIAKLNNNIAVLVNNIDEMEENIETEKGELKNLKNDLALLNGQNFQKVPQSRVDILQKQIATATNKALKAMVAAAVQKINNNTAPGTEVQTSSCAICFECSTPKARLDPCGHVLCRECAEQVSFCPTCTSTITHRQQLYI